jgi:uncharacterized damage-inducible protein DinB
VIEQPLAALTAARAQTLAALAPLSQAQLDFSPAAGRWSIGEVADHLILAESLYCGEIARLIELARAGQRPYLKRSFADINVSPLHVPTAVLSLLEAPIGMMSRLMPEAMRSIVTEFPLLPTRNPDRATPRPGRPAAELRDALARSLAETRALLTANAGLEFGRMISEHPLTGPSSVPRILGFLALHERRHQAQIERVRSNSRFPRP